MLKNPGSSIKLLPVFSGAFVAFGLYASSLYSYLLFHSLVELFSVLVAFVIFVLAWNTRRLLDSHYLLFIGIASLSSGSLDLVHILAYKGMGVFPGYGANLATQLWIAFRFVFSISLFLAPLFVSRKLPPEKTLAVFIVATAFLLVSVFLRWFPDCFIEGIGLTPFKIVSEYVICLIFSAALALLFIKRSEFDRAVFRLMALSIGSSIASELSFTQYASVHGAANMIGHFFELLSYMFIYRAIVVTGVVEPSNLLFRKLKQSEDTLRRSHEELEKRVQERTEELVRANEELESEIVERIRTERQIEESQQKLRDTLESINDGFFTLDREWRFTYVNTELTRLWQRSREELIGKSLWDAVPGAVGSPFETEYRRAVREKTPVAFEALSPMLGIWIEARAYPSRDGLSVHFHDISERKKTEENISRLNRLYSILSKVNEAIVRIHDPGKLYERVCRIAVEDGQFKMAWIGLTDTDTQKVRPIASYGDSGGYLDDININAAVAVAEGRGPTGKAVYEGTYSMCGDIEHDPRMLPWRDKALRHGFRSSAAFPLRAGSTAIGAFTIYSSKPQSFTGEEIALLNSLAEDLSFAIDSMNNERMRLEAEESLRASSEEIRVLYDNGKVTNDLLQLFPRKFSRKEYLDAAAVLIRDRCGCRHVGMRIADNDGNIPYESCAGYNARFLASESILSLKHDRCVCTRVVAGMPEPHEPGAMTPNGSFYCNDTSKFMEGLTEGQRTQYRGVCMKHGFLSLAVVPIRYRGDRVIGAIHLADEREGMVPHKNVEFVEQLAFIVGEAVFRFGIEEELKILNKELEQRVVQRTAQLEATNKELEAFAYSVSHDLRAPLRAIDGFSRVIEEEHAEKLGAAGRDHFRHVRAAGQKMAQLIDALLSLSRLTRGELHRTTVDLGALARKTVDDLRSQDAGRTVEFVIPDGLTVNGDPAMLRSAVDNLLSNAWKFTGKTPHAKIEFGACSLRNAECGISSNAPSGPPLKIRGGGGSYESPQSEIAYFVRDNGAGFDMTYVKKLFNAFQRLHSVNEFPGIGIGLATVARIVHRHGGEIWAEGEIGKGATFFFTLG